MMNGVLQFWQIFVSESDMMLSTNKRSPAPSFALVLWLRFNDERIFTILANSRFLHHNS